MCQGAARRLFSFAAGWARDSSISQARGRNPMITEIAQIDVKPGTEKDFEAAVAKARPLFLRAKGGKGFELHKSIEKPSRYRLMAKWETLENHTVDFRGSEDFTAWRGAGRAVFCRAARGRAHRDGGDRRLGVDAAGASGAVSSALKWSITTFTIAIRGSASASPQMPNTTPSRIWNANSVAGGMSSAWRWRIGVRT